MNPILAGLAEHHKDQPLIAQMSNDDFARFAHRVPFVGKDPGKRVLKHGHGVLETDAVLLDVGAGLSSIPLEERDHCLAIVWLRKGGRIDQHRPDC